MATQKERGIGRMVLRPKELAQALGLGKTTLWLWSKRPDFPPKIRLGPRAVGWDVDQVREWLRQRTEDR
jgi:prophage regulatory protein